MIFVTVGTTPFAFDRLLRAVDEAMVNSRSQELLVVQAGVSKHKFNYKKIKKLKEIAYVNLINYLKKARIVIAHAGPATIFQALKHSQQVPLIIPRLKKFKEQIDNHQLYYARFLRSKNVGKAILDSNNLEEEIKKYLKKPIDKKIIKKIFLSKEKLINKLNDSTS